MATDLFSQRFVNPVEGIYGRDFVIVNYVDWGLGDTIRDHECLDKTYNGHQGTDFVLRSFRQMDEGVNVLAVDTGVVIFVQDGIYDREKSSVIAKGLGNYIGITHKGKLQTYYGHLKENSIVVKVGETVYPGQVIGQVASSGNSTDPHLHFELWYDSTYYIDPFKGSCGNGSSYWLNPHPFDSSFAVWSSSTWNGFPTLDTLREEPREVDSFYRSDDQITYWSLMYGLRTGDSLAIEWRTPTGTLWHRHAYQLQRNWWYYYYFNYINVTQNMPLGEWEINLFRNNQPIDSRSVQVVLLNNDEVALNEKTSSLRTWQRDGVLFNNLEDESEFRLYTISGRVLFHGRTSSQNPIDISTLSKGIYIVSLQTQHGGMLTEKVIVR